MLRWLLGRIDPASSAPSLEAEELSSADTEAVERAAVVVSARLHEEFERNLRNPVSAIQMRLRGVDFFADTTWELHPRMNVVLGRNGYGKSLLLRTLAGMLQRDTATTGVVFGSAAPDARIEVGLSRDGTAEMLMRDAQVFLRDSAGKVPLLAIPDSRFVDRDTTTISSVGTIDFTTDGAADFLAQRPYQQVVEALLAGLVYDYFEDGKRFRGESFSLLDDVITELSGGQGFRFVEIERVGLAGAKVWVQTEGLEQRLLIQQVSQGTLSVVTIFGLIHRFLLQIAEATDKQRGRSVLEQRAIVIIDEVDAHLHPAWQQRVRNLLTGTFPNVQFIVSAHSPLIVAGCGPGEVSVLAKGTVAASGHGSGFWVEQVAQDFVGASAAEIYQRIFDIEDMDETFKEYLNKEARGQGKRNDQEIDKLFAKDEKGRLSDADRRRLDALVLEQTRLDRVAKVKEERRGTERRLAQRDAEIRRLKAELERVQPSGETTAP